MTSKPTPFPWPDDAITDLKALGKAGKSLSETAAFLSHKYKFKISSGAVSGKRMRIGISQTAESIKQAFAFKKASLVPAARKPPQVSKNEAASLDRVRRLLTPEVPVEEVNPDTISKHPRTIMDPLFGGCRWPLSLDASGSRLHCCNDRADQRPYCSAHKRLAYQASRSPAQIAHDAKLREASQRSYAEKALFARVNVR